MLNAYFAFGVPFFLLLLYIAFALFRRSSHIPYLGFVLFMIAGFMTAFSLQVIQQAVSQTPKQVQILTSNVQGYPFYLLFIPLFVGLLLICLNSYRGYKRLKKMHFSFKKN